tara:strand:- start:2949 stop:3146 length:198 start_codon:yes stop_codon:yes gene_type:complete
MTSQQLLNATLLHFKAVKARAEANLNIYLTAVVGVGEHADLVKEIIELTKTITEADEAIKYLENR